MADIKKVLKEASMSLRPSDEERKEFNKMIDEFLKKLNSKLKEGKAILGGSGAKDTWIKGVHDADIFVKFPYSKFCGKDTKMSDSVEKALKSSFKGYMRVHGSRDYFQLKIDDFLFEIVPILDIKSVDEAFNITDISPKHAEWVVKRSKNQDDIRLAKAFARTAGVYGAESYINGFSGYVIEILTIYYGSFEKLVKNAIKWKERTTIDIMKHHKNVMFEVNKSKLVSPLVLIDPVQAGRNTAAALSEENYKKFISACKNFLKNPKVTAFDMKEKTIEEIIKGKNTIVIEVDNHIGSEDVIGCKIVKVITFLLKELSEFNIKDSGFVWGKGGKAKIYIIHDGKKLGTYRECVGPEVERKEHVKAFKKKHESTLVKKGRIYGKDKRDILDINKVIPGLLKRKYVKEKVVKVKLIK